MADDVPIQVFRERSRDIFAKQSQIHPELMA